MAEYFPKVGDICYYMHKKVIVVNVLECFHLVKIKDLLKTCSFCVDKCSLTKEPNFTNSISLNLFDKENK